MSEAVSAPRVHVEGDRLDCEGGLDPGQLELLEQGGERLVRFDGLNLYFGGANAVAAGARRRPHRRWGSAPLVSRDRALSVAAAAARRADEAM